MINRKRRRRSLWVKLLTLTNVHPNPMKIESASFTTRLPSSAAKPPLFAPSLPPYWESYILAHSDRAD
jgi:hypothetical protein